jgi:hypothetical protein
MKSKSIISYVCIFIITGCAQDTYRYREPLPELNRKDATTQSVTATFGEPAKISTTSGESKEGPQMDLAYRYYFATRDGHPGAKIFYFYRGRWVGENVLGGDRREEFFRLLDPTKKSSRRLINEWETAHPHVW